MKISNTVKSYLETTTNKFELGQYEYYARIALEEALLAFSKGNYGIGAVAIFNNGKEISEFRDRNDMVRGLGVIDHAETRALIRLKKKEKPDFKYRLNTNKWTMKLPIGISVFGTLEPCPMCACTLTNAGAILSVSTVLDGNLKTTKDKYKISDGAANVLSDKFKIQPLIWQQIQTARKIKFQLLKTTDKQLKNLSHQIFHETRAEIDEILAKRNV